MVNEHADLAELLPPPGDPVLPAARERMLKEHLLHEIAREQAPAPRPLGSRMRRRLLVAGVPAAVALAVLAGVDASGVLDDGPAVTAAQSHRAEVLLTRIARAADSRPAAAVRDDQYVYTEVRGAKRYFADFLPGGAGDLAQREDWHAVDGRRKGLARIRAIPADGRASGHIDMTLDADPNGTTYRELTALPTDPVLLLRTLYARTAGQGPTHEEAVFESIGAMLPESLLVPDLNSALYRAASRLPGMVVVDGAADGAGRRGVGLAFLGSRHGTTWVFDPSTLAFLGTTRTAVIEVGIADRAGQPPVRG
ncbi:CU044_5270 family protein [Streptomyces sp. NPDC002574]|uniref:CU044_5270 family protein n=1 Tax=Streptomyces sp. NPDC002574 TaxID=3364652 RepID=UPI0036BCFFC5